MSSPPPGAEQDRVADEVGWARELNEHSGPPPVEPLQEPLWDTIKRVLVSPRAAMVDLGRDVDGVRKGVIVTIAYAAAAAVVSLAQAALGYPPEGTLLDGIGWIWIVLGVPLTLLGTLLAAYVLRLGTPSDLDQRVGPAFARLSLSWGVPGFVVLWLGVVEMALLASGLVTPEGLVRLYDEGIWLSLLALGLSLWPVAVMAIAIRVATQRGWLMVIAILIVATVVTLIPALMPLLLL